ncbi:hypothetical protein [Jatrophihabitans sp.]|uniref:hypothetical protein n=1 Tax=Jatrophihabitans sp. TaxID=1932789 RepID=UPI002F1496F6
MHVAAGLLRFHWVFSDRGVVARSGAGQLGDVADELGDQPGRHVCQTGSALA